MHSACLTTRLDNGLHACLAHLVPHVRLEMLPVVAAVARGVRAVGTAPKASARMSGEVCPEQVWVHSAVAAERASVVFASVLFDVQFQVGGVVRLEGNTRACNYYKPIHIVTIHDSKI